VAPRDDASPFDRVLGGYRRSLARPLANQFFGADQTHRVRMEGAMDHVWHRHSWLRPFFTLLALVDIFFPETGRDVPASMIVTQTPQGVAWRRTFWFPRVRRFNATMRHHSRTDGRGHDSVIECTGPAGALEIPWRVHVLARDQLEITTGRLMVRLGRHRIPVPGLMQVAVTAIERAVDDAIHIDLVLSHRLLGPIFGYDGSFTVRREPSTATSADAIGRGLRRYAPWFYAAAAYNLVWGTIAILWPARYFQLIGVAVPDNLAIWQALAMMVLVYAPAYWWLAIDPVRHRHLVLIAMLGKTLGPMGFLWALHTQALPLAFGLTIITNDLIWWPAFFAFLMQAAPLSGGWRNLLLGR
jgi:small multidrug resistance pump